MRAEPSIRSKAGQEHERLTDRAWLAILDHYCRDRGIPLILEKLHDLHPADGILRYGATGRPKWLVEIKSRRDFDAEEFWSRHKGKWLISKHKIINNIPIAKKLGCPFVGAMHIVESKLILIKTIWEDGTVAPGIETKTVETRRGIDDDGRKIVPCAFIPMHDALRIRY
jgi:hypothetical protein